MTRLRRVRRDLLSLFSEARTQRCARDGSLAATQTRWGWTAGGGFEAALFQNWSFKLEYLYVGLQDKSYFLQVTLLPDFMIVRRNVTLNDNILRVGLNYRFQ